jgi:hybrid cluster-associated redox disulfide protein
VFIMNADNRVRRLCAGTKSGIASWASLPNERQTPMCDLHPEDPDLPIADLLRRWPETMSVFIARGMLCVGCMIGPYHTIDDACIEYGIDPERLLAELRDAIMAAAAPKAQAGVAEQR